MRYFTVEDTDELQIHVDTFHGTPHQRDHDQIVAQYVGCTATRLAADQRLSNEEHGQHTAEGSTEVEQDQRGGAALCFPSTMAEQ